MEVAARRSLATAAAFFAFGSASYGQQAPDEDVVRRIDAARVVPRSSCAEPSSGNEIVVCGRGREEEKYRIPPSLRESPPGHDGTAWGARMREFEIDQRLGGTTVGPGGYLKHQQQRVREWRDERAQIARDKAELKRKIDKGVR